MTNMVNETYYLDLSEIISKECFHSCKSCYAEGNEINNNCIECKEGFAFLEEFNNTHNCQKLCPYYYYFNESIYYICTVNPVCPEKYAKLIPQYKKCIENCWEDNFYKYDYNNICYDKCPSGTNLTESYTCKDIEFVEQFIYKCSNDHFLINMCSLRFINNDSDIYSVIKNKIIKEYSLDTEKIQIIDVGNNINYQITTGKNELEILKSDNNSLNNYNLTIIDLGKCEEILKDEYNINNADPLIYLIKQKLANKVSEKEIHLEIFEPYNKTQLNL